VSRALPKSVAEALVGAVLLMSMAAVPARAADKMPLGSSVEIPAAQGEARFHATRNGNTEIQLNVRHLAPPGRIAPGTSVFVVWVRGLSPRSEAQNLGALRVDKNLNGRLRAVTAMPSFDLFLTCEQSQTVIVPAPLELLPVQRLVR